MLFEIKYPVSIRYRSPVGTYGRVIMLDYQTPIIISGELTETVAINLGDFIFGDPDGVLVVPRVLTLKVLEVGERILETENKARKEFQAGVDPIKVFKKYRRFKYHQNQDQHLNNLCELYIT